MVAVETYQHCAAASVLAYYLACAVEDFKEGNSSRRCARNIFYTASLRPETADVYAYTAAVGEDFRNFLIDLKNRLDIVLR